MGVTCCASNKPTQAPKMKLMILAVVLAVASAAPSSLQLESVQPVAIVSSRSEMNQDGSYAYAFESDNGIKVEESGSQKQVGDKPEEAGTVSKGSYSYTSGEGVVLTINWVADENGFQATGDHLPTPPPMPAHVIKLLSDLQDAGVL